MSISQERVELLFDINRFGDMVVDVLGVGGVGGYLGLHLKKKRVHLRMFDNDYVGLENVSSQLYGPEHVGMRKVDAFASIAAHLAEAPQQIVRRRVGPKYQHGDIVFLCVDSMHVRKAHMLRFFRSRRPPKLVIETRIDTNNVVVHSIIPRNKNHQRQWLRYWFPDAKAENDGGCGDKRALSCAASLAADIADSQLVQWFGNGRRDLKTAPDNQIRVTMRPWSSKAQQW